MATPSTRSRGALYAIFGNKQSGDRAAVVQSPALAKIQAAKAFVQAGLGLEEPGLLAEGFTFLDPLRGSHNKKAYLSGLDRLNLKAAFPDLDLRAHDFRVDRDDPNKVWFTTRVMGTHKGTLVLGKEEIAPTGIKMELPPEANCVTIGADGKVVRAVGGGIVLDRSVGNSAGLGGEYGIAAALGRPVSAFKHTPPQKVFQDFFARTFKPSTAAPPVFSPLPEAVMIGLAKGLLASDFGATDPDLLAKDFKFIGPLVGPLPRETFVKAFSSFNLRRAFPDIKNEAYDFRVDPYDPTRVWFTVRSTGTFTGAFGEGRNSLPPNGNKYSSGPEGISVSFNDKGQCVKLTVGVLMDPEVGDTGGLGGVFGVLFAVGSALPPFVTRPLPQHLRHWKNYVVEVLTSPFTGSGGEKKVAAAPASAPAAPVVKKAAAPSVVVPAAKSKPVAPSKPAPPKAVVSKPSPPPVQKKATPPPPPPAPKKPTPPPPAPVRKVVASTPATPPQKAPTASASNPFANLFGGGDKKKPSPAASKPSTPPPAAKRVVAPAPKASAVVPPKRPTPVVAAKPAPKPVSKPVPKPVSKPAGAPVKAATPAAPKTESSSGGAFSFFGGGNKKATVSSSSSSPVKKPSVQAAGSRPKVVSNVKAGGIAKKK